MYQQQTTNELRQKMIRYLDLLLTKSHILMKPTLASYRTKLDMDDNLTTSEFTHLLKFLVRDSNRTRSELKNYYAPIIGKHNKIINNAKETNSLESFFEQSTTKETETYDRPH